MSPGKEKDFNKKLRKFKKDLKIVVEEYNYPYMETLLDTMLFLIKDYDKRKKAKT